MAKASEKPLQPNPFNTYRDPQTGMWIVIQTTAVLSNRIGKETDSFFDSTQGASS